MGENFVDQFTYLHFAVGIIAYYWNINLYTLFLIHTIFELSENTEYGIEFINISLSVWPGGKYKADTYINILGDTIGVLLGWWSAKIIDNIGIKYGLYFPHITK